MAKSNKLNIRERILTTGRGDRRVVLDYDSGLVYQYSEPENVLASYESGKGWIILKKPYYSSGGWGSGSKGDADSHYRISHARELLSAIDATYYEINSYAFMTPEELKTMNKAIESNNKLIEQQNKIAKNLDVERLNKVDSIRLSLLCKGSTLKGLDAISTAQNFKSSIETFVNAKGKTRKVESYSIAPNLVKQGETVVAFRDSIGQVFMNSQVIALSTFERSLMGSQSIVQSEIRKLAKYSIPFNVLASANLDLNKTKVIEQGPESTHQIKKNQYSGETIERHFTGALLLENSGRKFLMDIDRIEIQHKLFNAFFVEVDSKVNSILEAYESMKPEEVRQAEKQGLEVRRQGEWFFVKTDKTIEVNKEKVKSWQPGEEEASKLNQYVLKRAVSHGKGRPNNLFKPVGFGELDELVCGVVSHQGREHADLNLGVEVVSKDSEENEIQRFTLWKLVPNSTVSNFTINGDID